MKEDAKRRDAESRKREQKSCAPGDNLSERDKAINICGDKKDGGATTLA